MKNRIAESKQDGSAIGRFEDTSEHYPKQPKNDGVQDKGDAQDGPHRTSCEQNMRPPINIPSNML